MKKMMKGLLLLIASLSMFGCGGGGGGGTGIGSKDEPDPVATTAVVKLFAEGALPEGTALAGIGITVNLPAGVTVRTDEAGKVAAGSVEGSGVTTGRATLAEPDYTPATDAATAKLTFVLAGTEEQGFGTGEFATVTCDVAAGTAVQAADITLSGFSPVDLRGAPVEGLSATHTTEIR